jgi:2-polyprenyl-3-methyl-5-hydroxy-6-metoxy-1,4-benzoquinol methylase
MTYPPDYAALLAAEGQVWSAAAQEIARHTPPDWSAMRRTTHYAVVGAPHIDHLLTMIRPGWRVLEIGCASGWLSLEMARRGAEVEGIDVAAGAIALATEYAAAHPPTAPGRVQYRVADLNALELPAAHYDLIVALGVLHHLVDVSGVLGRLRRALKPGGLLHVGDPLDTPRANTLIAAVLTMLLPTQLTYRQKLGHLFRLRGAALAHLRDSIEARGLSPFEGVGRDQEPLEVIRALYDVRAYTEFSAFTGYVVAQLRLPRAALIGLGRALYVVDRLLVRLRLLRGLLYTLTAVSPQNADGHDEDGRH